MKRSILHNIFCLVLAITYFAFHAEFFDTEYQENHRVPSSTLSFAKPSVTWETFDKMNAQKAFKMIVDVTIEPLGIIRVPSIRITPPLTEFDIIRDKSPPEFLS